MTLRKSFWPPPLGPRKPHDIPELKEHLDLEEIAGRPARITTIALFAFSVAHILTMVTLAALIYVMLDLKEARDRQQERDRQLQRDIACSMADTLPADHPVLERLREEFGCGPGVPLEELPADVQQYITGGGGGHSLPPLPGGTVLDPGDPNATHD